MVGGDIYSVVSLTESYPQPLDNQCQYNYTNVNTRKRALSNGNTKNIKHHGKKGKGFPVLNELSTTP
jgi:hypothetical protein